MCFLVYCVLFVVTLPSQYADMNSTRPEDCGLGELWQEGNSCPKNCSNIRQILDDLHDPPEKRPLKICEKQKQYGCFCRSNLLRNSSGDCVHFRDCPYTPDNCYTLSHEVWRTGLTSCPRKCEDLERHDWARALQCIVDKFDYCFCRRPYYRDVDGDGRCIKGRDCKIKVCKENEVLSHGINCPPTCDTLNDRPEDCYEHRGRTCYCKSGVYKNSLGICVKPEDCDFNAKSWNYNGGNAPANIAKVCTLEDFTSKPMVITPHKEQQKEEITFSSQKCNNNETLSTEASSCTETCDDIRVIMRRLHATNGETLQQICDLPRDDNCSCNPGLLRVNGGPCVDKKDCPFTKDNCKNNEVFRDNATACPRTCENPSWPPGLECRIDKFDYCYCKEGFYRDEDGVGDCVVLEACTLPALCRENEIFRHGSNCPITCAKMNVSPQDCCITKRRKCFCNAGLMRNSKGKCVNQEDCDWWAGLELKQP